MCTIDRHSALLRGMSIVSAITYWMGRHTITIYTSEINKLLAIQILRIPVKTSFAIQFFANLSLRQVMGVATYIII